MMFFSREKKKKSCLVNFKLRKGVVGSNRIHLYHIDIILNKKPKIYLWVEASVITEKSLPKTHIHCFVTGKNC